MNGFKDMARKLLCEICEAPLEKFWRKRPELCYTCNVSIDEALMEMAMYDDLDALGEGEAFNVKVV